MITVCLPDDEARERVGELEGVRVVVWDGTGHPPAGAADAEVLVAPYAPSALDDGALKHLGRLRLIQLLSAGVDPWLPIVPDGVTLAGGRGIHGGSTAELALAGLLAVLRELPGHVADQADHAWRPAHTDSLDGKHVVVLGAGDIGSRVARAVEVFGATTTLVARRARDGVRSLDDLTRLARAADVLVVAVPLTDDTRGLVDAELLAALPDGAVLVNVARGPVVITDALVAELTARRLRAYLDVTDPEPLPADHPLWDAPGVVITPHVGGGTTGWQRRAYELVRAQLIAYRDGTELANVVTAGY